MSGGNRIASILLMVLGGLWIFLTGGCCEAVFKGMAASDKVPLVLLCTLPGCILALAGLAMRLTREVAAILILAYAATLSFVWTSAVLAASHGDPKGMLILLSVFNVPPGVLAIWGLVLLFKRGQDRTR